MRFVIYGTEHMHRNNKEVVLIANPKNVRQLTIQD
jgi:hypothetical protein